MNHRDAPLCICYDRDSLLSTFIPTSNLQSWRSLMAAECQETNAAVIPLTCQCVWQMFDTLISASLTSKMTTSSSCQKSLNSTWFWQVKGGRQSHHAVVRFFGLFAVFGKCIEFAKEALYLAAWGSPRQTRSCWEGWSCFLPHRSLGYTDGRHTTRTGWTCSRNQREFSNMTSVFKGEVFCTTNDTKQNCKNNSFSNFHI